MTTVMTTNNGYDSVLLVDETDRVVSAWMADRETIDSYLQFGARPEEWHTDEFHGFVDPARVDNEDKLLRTIGAYGTEVGRSGVIDDATRRQFWIRE